MVATEQQELTLSQITPVQKANSRATSVISGEKLKQLYMVMVALRAHKKNKSRGSTPYFAEACEAAAVIDLRQGDTVATLPGQRVDVVVGSQANNGTDHKSATSPSHLLELGGHERLVIAAGIAFAYRTLRTNSVVIAFAAANEIAAARDSLLFAQNRTLPIIYLEKAKNRIRTTKPKPHDLPTIPVQDTDVVAAYRVAFEAIEKARRGVGPTLIQCIETESHSKSTSTHEREDSIAYMERYLRKQNLWSDELRF